jgi:anti-sigma factor RsiW
MTRPNEPSAMSCEDVHLRLERYLDDDLSPKEYAVMQSHLSECEACHSELTRVKAFEVRLREAFRGERSPPALWPRIAADLGRHGAVAQAAGERRRVGYPSRRVAIAAAALLAVGFVVMARRLVTAAVDSAELMQTPVGELRSFIDSGRPVDFVTTDPAVLRAWFMDRVDFVPPAPTPRLTLVGGRLCYFFERRIASYMYKIDGHLVSLYLMSNKGIEPPSASHEVALGTRAAAIREVDGFAHMLWKEGSLYYSLVSDQPAAQLVELARALATVAGEERDTELAEKRARDHTLGLAEIQIVFIPARSLSFL